MGRRNSKKRKQVNSGRKNKKSSGQSNTFKGTLDITRSGMAYVIVKDLESDIVVKPSDLNSALHGDTVIVKAKKEEKGRRMKGVVTEILHRKQNEFIGRLEMNQNFGFFIPEMERPMPDVFIPVKNLNGANDNDRVIVRILEWEKDGKRPVGEVVSVLDADDSNDIAMKEILLQSGFPLEFPDEAIEEAARISDVISKSEIKKRKDFREVLTFTIDPHDAKDFDDAISFVKLKNGNYEIAVHIADVSHYVSPDTALDNAAYEKATSVYLPDRVNPMLPEEISNVLCSLRPREDKLCFAAVFEITPKATIKNFWLGKTIIHSDHRFTYEEVQEIIETKDGLYNTEIQILNDLAQRMREHAKHAA
jgi:ribonuclease R